MKGKKKKWILYGRWQEARDVLAYAKGIGLWNTDDVVTDFVRNAEFRESEALANFENMVRELRQKARTSLTTDGE